jgi:integrase/recombinase XerD
MQTIEEYIIRKYSQGTSERYIRSIQQYIVSVGVESALKAKYKDIWDYVGKLKDKGYSEGFIVVELAAIKNYYKYLVYSGERLDNPTRNVIVKNNSNSRQIQHQDLFTPAELELLMNKEIRYRILENKMKLAISLYIYQGLTTGEIASLTLDSINIDEEIVYIKASSRLNSRILQLHPKQITIAQNYIHFERDQIIKEETNSLFVNKLGYAENLESFHYLIESQRYLFQERNLNPKTVRQSVIVNWFRQGHGIKEVQIMAGHKYPSTTEAYQPTDLEALKSSIGRFHPLGSM